MMKLYRKPSWQVRRLFCVVAVWTGLQTAAWAQGGALAGAVVGLVRANMDNDFGTANEHYFRRGKGSYKLANAEWQTDHLAINQIQLSAGRGKEPKTHYLNEVEQVVMGVDSFVTVTDVRIWGQPQAAPALVLARRAWRRPQVELLMVETFTGAVPIVRFPGHSPVALPTKKKEFQQAMLALVGDHPTLAEQLRAGQLEASHTRQILDLYLRWKPSGFDAAALTSARSTK